MEKYVANAACLRRHSVCKVNPGQHGKHGKQHNDGMHALAHDRAQVHGTSVDTETAVGQCFSLRTHIKQGVKVVSLNQHVRVNSLSRQLYVPLLSYSSQAIKHQHGGSDVSDVL